MVSALRWTSSVCPEQWPWIYCFRVDGAQEASESLRIGDLSHARTVMKEASREHESAPDS